MNCIQRLALFAGTLLIFSACDNQKASFRIGTASGYAPYVSCGPNGCLQGFDIDFIAALQKRVGFKIKVIDLGSMDALLLALERQKIDAIVWGMTINAGRRKQYTLIHYAGKPQKTQPVVFWDQKLKISSLADLKDQTVAVEPGSIQESFALTNPGLRLKPFAKALDMVFDLKFGRSNAALIDPDILPRFLKRFPKLTVCQLPLPKAQRSDGLGIVMKKSISAKKVRALQQAISFLKKQGVMKKLAKKWDVCRDRR